MPGGNHAELLGLHETGTPGFDHQVDPLLLAFDDRTGMTLEDGLALSQHNAGAFEHGFDHHGLPYSSAEGVAGPLITDYRPKEWMPDSTSPAFDPQSSEFDTLWDEHEKNAAEGRKASLRSHFEEQNLGGAVQAVAEEGHKSPKSS